MNRIVIQFMLPKFAIALMFGLVTLNFNRVAIGEYGLSALLVAVMIGMYPFFGPFQPYFGRLTERFPIFGYKRSPWLIIGLMTGSVALMPLPYLLEAHASGAGWAIPTLFLLFFIFGTAIALMANTYLDLIADCTTDALRGTVFAAAWTGQTLILVVWAFLFRLWLEDESQQALQQLYLWSPIMVFVLGLLGVIGLEKRSERIQIDTRQSSGGQVSPLRDSLHRALHNPTARRFFLFISLSFFGIFTQDLIQEVMAGDVFGLNVGDSSIFQQLFNTGVALGMGLTAAFGARVLGSNTGFGGLTMTQKKRLATGGGFAAAATFGLIAIGVGIEHYGLTCVAFGLNGLAVGVFTMPAVTMMSDMSVNGETGKYLGIWSMAQAFGLGGCFILSGILYEVLIASQMFSVMNYGYAAFFVVEGALMVWCVYALRPASVDALRRDAVSLNGASLSV